MIKQVAILSFILMLAAAISVNCAYASQYSLSNEDEQTRSQVLSQEPHVGKVAETMNSGGYTYILLQTKTKTRSYSARGLTKGSGTSARRVRAIASPDHEAR